MKVIDDDLIRGFIAKADAVSDEHFDRILAKARTLTRLDLEEAAVLIATGDPSRCQKIYREAAAVKAAIYGARVVLFAPIYINNHCVNGCLYCAFHADNARIPRSKLTIPQIREQTEFLLKRGHKRVLLVSSESGASDEVDFYVEAMKTIYAARAGCHAVRRVNVNCAPLSVEDFRKLKKVGIGTYQLFQETYHEPTYRRVHPHGPKSDPKNRLAAVDRAFEAGIDDVGIGALFGLYDYRYEVLALLSHVAYLEKTFGVGPHTISVPRIEPAPGVDERILRLCSPSDEEFKKIVAVLRLAVPYTGIILSTRESAALRDELFSLGVSQVSAESRTSPGGYGHEESAPGAGVQFQTSDQRSLDEVIGALLDKGFIPSFCAACYRKERTGEAFMDLAKPGTIQSMCQLNALITFKEYLDDFASEEVRRSGYLLIKKMTQDLDATAKNRLAGYFADIDKGLRDLYV